MSKSYQQLDELPAEVGTAVLHWTLSVADTKHRIGLQFSHWVTGTPALEAAVGSAAITQDELGHARSLYGLLRHHPNAPEGIGAENDLEARDVFYAPAALALRWESWLQVIASNVVLDSALTCAVAATEGSSFQPLAGRTAKILQEERFHRIFGDQWLKRLMGRDDTTQQKLQAAIDWAWPITLGWLGPDNDPIVRTLVEAGVLKEETAVIRTRWLEIVRPILRDNGLAVPSVALNWEGWNGRFRHIDHA